MDTPTIVVDSNVFISAALSIHSKRLDSPSAAVFFKVVRGGVIAVASPQTSTNLPGNFQILSSNCHRHSSLISLTCWPAPWKWFPSADLPWDVGMNATICLSRRPIMAAPMRSLPVTPTSKMRKRATVLPNAMRVSKKWCKFEPFSTALLYLVFPFFASSIDASLM